MGTFDQIDANGDGVISREEFEAMQAGMRGVAPGVTYMQAPGTVTTTMGGVQYLAEPVATTAGYTMQAPVETLSAGPPTTVVAEPVYISAAAPQAVTMAPPTVTETVYAAAPTITTAEPVYMQAPAARAMEAPATMMSPIITTAQPVYLTAPAVMESRDMVEVGEPTPVATNMRPPVPVSSTLQVVQGGVRQEKVVTESFRDEGRTTVTSYAPTTTVTKELGQAVYVTGPTTEEESAPQITIQRTEQLVMGEVTQQIVEVPQVQIQEMIEEVPEIQIIKKTGGTLRDSYLDPDGFLLDKKIGVGCPKRMTNCKVIVANTSMDTDKVKIYGSKIKVDSVSKVAEIEAAEKAKMNAKVDRILAHGCNVFCNRQLIYNLPEQRLADAGVMSIEHAEIGRASCRERV